MSKNTKKKIVKRKSKTVKKAKQPQKAAAKTKKARPKQMVINVKKLLAVDEAIKYVVDLSGEKGLEVFEYLIDHGQLEENALAKRLKFEKANAIRKFLYKLYNKNLVSYSKKKSGSKAWYTYFWKANPERLVFLLQKEYEDEIQQAKKAIELNKANDFYVCDTCNRRYELNRALENDFKCANCGSVLTHIEQTLVLGDKENRISFLKNKIEKLKELVTYK